MYVNHQEKIGGRVCKDAITKLMLEHAPWLAQEARKYVDVQSWKEFAKTGTLDVDEEPDVEMDELELNNSLRRISGSPAPLAPSSNHRRVRRLF